MTISRENARELLLHLEVEEVISTQVNHENATRTSYNNYSASIIEYLVNSKLLVIADVISISINSSIEVFKSSILGSQLSEFVNLVYWYNEGVDGEEQFLKTGSSIYKVLAMFDEKELEPLVSLLTSDEQEAYNHYYRIATMQVLKRRSNEIKLNDNQVEVLETGLNEMFSLSVELGSKGTDETRTNNYVLKKCMEELGEMALEDNIADGLSYKEAGSDGVAGEAVDLAICAMDMFALQHPNNTAEEIQYLFLSYMNKKLNKWKETLGNKD